MERGLCKKGFQEGERGRNKERSALEERDRARRRSSRSMKSERRSGGAAELISKPGRKLFCARATHLHADASASARCGALQGDPKQPANLPTPSSHATNTPQPYKSPSWRHYNRLRRRRTCTRPLEANQNHPLHRGGWREGAGWFQANRPFTEMDVAESGGWGGFLRERERESGGQIK